MNDTSSCSKRWGRLLFLALVPFTDLYVGLPFQPSLDVAGSNGVTKTAAFSLSHGRHDFYKHHYSKRWWMSRGDGRFGYM